MSREEPSLVQQANRRIQDGDWRGAARLLARAAVLAEGEGRGAEAARARQMAASLLRFAGDTEGALASAQALAATATADPDRVAFAAAAERAEALAAAGDGEAAVAAYRDALTYADVLRLPATWRAAVLRRLGEAQARTGSVAAARASYAEARALHAQSGDTSGARLVEVEYAEALVGVATGSDVTAAIEAAQAAQQDAALAPRLALLRARLALQQGDVAAALGAAQETRELALDAVEPVAYFAAAALLAQVHVIAGDRMAAYRALATAWVTLGDLLGRDIAASWVRPLLLALAVQWGEAGFAQVKAAYDAERHAAQGSVESG
jgi:hypothetical protein